MIQQIDMKLPVFRKGFHLITREIVKQLPVLPEKGLVHIMVMHTSAGITMNENADPSVRVDFESVFNHLVPERLPFLTHTIEGDDDMPAHIKASLVGHSVTIPVTGHQLNMGTWQGIYFCEFRENGGRRRLVITVYGE